MYPVGLDIGNACVKVCGPAQSHRLMIPHAVADAEGRNRDVALLGPGEDPLDHLHAEVWMEQGKEPQRVMAGALVVREHPGRAVEAKAGELKSASERFRTLALVSLAAVVQKADPQAAVARLFVVTALPMAEARDVENRRRLEAALKGRHTVRWLGVPGWSGKVLQMQIERVDVVPEGAAAYFAAASDAPELLDKRVMVADIGLRSVDWAVFEPRGRFALDLSSGSMDGGIQVAADKILVNAKMRYGPNVGRHRWDVLDALQQLVREGKAELWGGGRPHDVTALAQEALANLGRTVSSILKEATDQVGRTDACLLVGGGAALIRPWLDETVASAFVLVKEPMWANARGMWIRAAALMAQQGVLR